MKAQTHQLCSLLASLIYLQSTVEGILSTTTGLPIEREAMPAAPTTTAAPALTDNNVSVLLLLCTCSISILGACASLRR